MRVNYIQPTREEIGDPMAKLARVIAFRKSMNAPRPSVKPEIKILPPPPPAPVYFNGTEDHPAIERPEFVDGEKIPYSSHAYLPPGGDWHQRQREKEPPTYLSVAQCIAYVSVTENISRMDIIGPWRQKHIIEARHRAMWLVRRYGDPERATFPFIGRHFGGRDHTTALSAWRKMEARVKSGAWVPPTFEEVASVARNAGVMG